MALAETAKLAVDMSLTGNFKSNLLANQQALASFTSRVEGGVGRVQTAVGKFGGSLNHAKGAIGELLTGPLGVLGLAGGLGGIGITFEHLITHTNDFAFSVEKLTGLTGGTAESMSTLLAVFEKFNINAERTGMIVGFAEKTLGKLAHTTTSAGKSAADLAKDQAAVTKAHEKLVVATLKLHELEAKGKASASQLTAARFKERDAVTALNEAENKLAADRKNKGGPSLSKLTELDQEYGLHLIDTKGHIVDFETELKQVADVYTSSINPARKAALAATLFGRGYADLVPILALGSKGITEAEQAAKDLGLTLTSQNAKDLKDYRESLRETADAIGGLELQIGLALVPAIKDMADAITRFLKNGGREKIVAFFKDMIQAGRNLADVVTGSIVPAFAFVAGAAKTAWDAIPAPFRDLLLKGFIADKTVKFLFGFSPIKFATGALATGLAPVLGNVLGKLIGKGVVQPVFVTNPGLGGGVPGTGGPGSGLGSKLLALSFAGAIVAAAVPIGKAFADALPAGLKGVDGTGKSDSQLARERANAAMLGTASHPLVATLLDRGGREKGFNALAGKLKDDRVSLGQLLKANAAKIASDQLEAMRSIWAPISRALRTLGHTNDPAKIAAAVKELEQTLVKEGHGNLANTRTAVHELEAQLKRTHDPTLQDALRHAISDLKAKIPGREYAERQIAKADKIFRSTQSTADKIRQLQAIENDLKNHKLPGAIHGLEGKINALKTADVTAQHATANAIKAKKTNLNVTIPITNRTYVNSRNVITTVHTLTNFYSLGSGIHGLSKP